MRNRYTALIQRDGKWFIASCPEVPEANGQGKTREECLANLFVFALLESIAKDSQFPLTYVCRYFGHEDAGLPASN